MTRRTLVVGRRRCLLLSALLLPAATAPLGAQQSYAPVPLDTAATDSAAKATTSRRIPAATLARLPVDSIEGALLLEAGVSGSSEGLSLRGAEPGSYATWLGGFDITPGTRRIRAVVPPNATGGASVLTGPPPAWAGGSGTLRLAIPVGGARGRTLSWQTDRFTSGLGLNRVEGALAGATRTSRFFFGGVAFGRKSAEPGMDGRDIPIFAPAGVDTTLDLPAGPIDVPAFAMARGDCARFEGSGDPRIAGNYGVACDDDRTPFSAESGYQLLFAADYRVGRASALEVVAMRSRRSSRLFDYRSILLTENVFGRETGSELYGIALAGALGPRRQGTWRLAASRQTDRLTMGPLTAEGEEDSRDPAGGFMLGGLGFRWDLESFPVDSTLVENYRRNRAGSVRSPLPLEDTNPFRPVDAFADGPYALAGFFERGGPSGVLTLFRERRTTLAALAAWPSTSNATITLGGELVRYDVTSYDHPLLSQAGAGIHLETPTRLALHVEDHFDYDRFEFVAGLRLDRFAAGAERPWVLDTVATIGGSPNPRFGEYYPFPRIASYTDADGVFQLGGATLPLVSFRTDEAHAAWSPTFRAGLDVGRARVRAGIARFARMPDLADVYQGVNTDLATTSLGHPFGTDLPFERGWTSELGVTQEIGGGIVADIAAFRRSTSGIGTYRIVDVDDPTRAGTAIGIVRIEPVGTSRATGIETRLGWAGPVMRATLAWTWQRIRLGAEPQELLGPGVSVPPGWERPHSLTALVDYVAPDGVRSSLFRRSSLSLGFRWTSGTPYDRCAGVTLSGEPCANPPTGTLRLPGFRQLDLRYARHVGGPRSGATAFLDVRNVFGRRNTERVYAATGTTSHPEAEADARAAALHSFELQGAENGVVGESGELDLGFAGQGAGGCGSWVSPGGEPAPAACVTLVRAEARWGNGDGVFTVAEQSAAADASYAAFAGSGFYGSPRRVRLGIELTF